jgi:hypothetical protein
MPAATPAAGDEAGAEAAGTSAASGTPGNATRSINTGAIISAAATTAGARRLIPGSLRRSRTHGPSSWSDQGPAWLTITNIDAPDSLTTSLTASTTIWCALVSKSRLVLGVAVGGVEQVHHRAQGLQVGA